MIPDAHDCRLMRRHGATLHKRVHIPYINPCPHALWCDYCVLYIGFHSVHSPYQHPGNQENKPCQTNQNNLTQSPAGVAPNSVGIGLFSMVGHRSRWSSICPFSCGMRRSGLHFPSMAKRRSRYAPFPSWMAQPMQTWSLSRGRFSARLARLNGNLVGVRHG